MSLTRAYWGHPRRGVRERDNPFHVFCTAPRVLHNPSLRIKLAFATRLLRSAFTFSPGIQLLSTLSSHHILKTHFHSSTSETDGSDCDQNLRTDTIVLCPHQLKQNRSQIHHRTHNQDRFSEEQHEVGDNGTRATHKQNMKVSMFTLKYGRSHGELGTNGS